MRKPLLIYESQTGFTQRYAQWIGEALEVQAIPLKQCSQAMVDSADYVIFGGSVRGSIISGQTKIERMLKKSPKPILYFAVGLRPATARTIEILRKNNFGIPGDFPLHSFRGGMDPEKLSSGDRTMLQIYRAMLRRRKDLDAEDQEMLSILRQSGDYTDKGQIGPLLEAARSLAQ